MAIETTQTKIEVLIDVLEENWRVTTIAMDNARISGNMEYAKHCRSLVKRTEKEIQSLWNAVRELKKIRGGRTID